MRISQLRDEVIAPVVRVTPPVLRARTDMLYREPALRAVLPGRRHGRGDNAGLTATYGSAALVLLAGMLDEPRDKIGPAVVRVWEGQRVTPTGNPIERAKTAGAVLTLLLKSADVRSRLLFLLLDKDVPHMAFLFGNPDVLTSRKPQSALEWEERIDRAVAEGKASRTFFAPYTPAHWKRRADQAFERGEMAHICRLGPATLTKIAKLISQEK
jgi:hypothetical protein